MEDSGKSLVLQDMNILKSKEEKYNSLLKELKIDGFLLKILTDRGYDTKESINNFLYGNSENLTNPYLIRDMDKACKIINDAVKNNKKIFVYGDYDCDGICSVSVLKLFFKDRNIDIDYYIPDRNNEGYGLNAAALEQIIKEYKPDLFITVDCGISAHDEINYLKAQGVEVIVTDHHELPPVLPECVTVSSKISADSRLGDLCGAGVVLKLVEALSDRKYAMQFSDIVSIATVADMVPLINDNRIIVREGLKILNTIDKRLGLSLLFQKCRLNNIIKSSDIAYNIAPHINSAGRIDKAYEVVELFCSKDYFIVDTLTDKLMKYNTMRQELCNKIFADAAELMKSYDFKNKFIALYSEEWESGLIGIAAAKLAGEFSRPVVLFSKKDNILRGSARSSGNINLFEALSACKDNYINFGGHSAACGLSLLTENFGIFTDVVNKYLTDNYSDSDYGAKKKYDYDLTDELFNLNKVKELNKLEPFGTGNPKLVFRLNKNLNFARLYSSNHLKYKIKDNSVMAFNMLPYQSLFNSKSDIDYYADLGINEYKNSVSVQAVINNFELKKIDEKLEETLFTDYYKQLLYGYETDLNITEYKSFEDVLEQSEDYGTLVITYSMENFSKFQNFAKTNNKKYNICFSTKTNLNPINLICFSPSGDFPYDYYKKIVFLERPFNTRLIRNIQNKFSATVCFLDTILPSHDIMIDNRNLNYITEDIQNLIDKGVYFNSIDTLYYCLIKTSKHTWAKSASLTEFTIMFYILFEQKAISVDKNFGIKLNSGKTDYRQSEYRRFFKEKNE